jgi:hypothetical protein
VSRTSVRNAASASVLAGGELVERAATHHPGIGTGLETLGGAGLPPSSPVTQPVEQGLAGRLRLPRHVDLLSRLPFRARYASGVRAATVRLADLWGVGSLLVDGSVPR